MPPKRKRSGPVPELNRPSPHRPAETPLGQHDRDDSGGRGRGRPRGGASNRRDSGQGHRSAPSQQSSQQASQPPQRTHSLAQGQSRPPPQPIAPPSQRSEPPSKTQPPVQANYQYNIIKDDATSSWATTGQKEITELGIKARQDNDALTFASLSNEFVFAVLEARLEPRAAGLAVKEILGAQVTEVDDDAFEPRSLFLDSLSITLESDPELYRNTLYDFLVATDLPAELLQQELDASLLLQLGLTRATFTKGGIRHATNLLYRQANYNLLREESEGYSKVITELFAASSLPNSTTLAEETFEKIKALIGAFDLDVGRVLDVTLDVTASLLIKQHKFWVKLLRASSWWPRSSDTLEAPLECDGLPRWALPGYLEEETAQEDDHFKEDQVARDVKFWDRAREVHLAAFFEAGGRQVLESHQKQFALANGQDKDETSTLEQQWIKETNTLPLPGNRVAAQLLGFKMLFYYSNVRSASDILPANLLYLVSILVKIGFISLADLYPHLSPSDEVMEEVRTKRAAVVEEEERETRGGPMNALLMAGTLPEEDDDNTRRDPTRRSEPEKKQAAQEESKKEEDEPLEQKVSLLIELLTVGAIPEALFILGRFPWIIDLYPTVRDRIHRILHVSLAKVYGETRPTSNASTDCPSKQIADADQSGIPKGSVRLSSLPPKKCLRWPFPDEYESSKNGNQCFRFYWDEWADNIPVCQTVDDVFTLCASFLNLSGVNIGKDDTLLAKLASIGAKSLADDSSDSNLSRWQDLLRRLLVPALSHTKANASVVNAIWELLRRFPTTTRYAIYAEWFEGQISRLPAMKKAFAKATSETRGIMKRVSIQNVAEMAKKLAKSSTSSPGITFRVAIEQLESYSNLIEAFVECAKYFTDMSYDVLIWTLMNSLGKSRSRTQADHALTTSKWLTALSRLSGKVFRRYSALSPTPVLHYVNDQLLQGNSTDLVILKEFIASMGGIVDTGDFTDYQVLSMAGGEVLRRHTLVRAMDKRYENASSSKRLVRALLDSDLGARLLISLVQYRQAALFKIPDEQAHIKLLSWMVDDTHQTLMKYIDFLSSNLDPDMYDTVVPSITQLMDQYGLDTSLAFLIGRPSLANKMFPWKSKKKEDQEKSSRRPSQDNDGDVAMADGKADINDKAAIEASAIEDQAVQAEKMQPSDTATEPSSGQKPEDQSLIRVTLQPIADAIQQSMPSEVWQKIAPELYVTFWALQLGDLYYPDKIYRQERERLKAEEIIISKDRSDMSRRGQEKKMEKRKELMQLQIALAEESKEHMLRSAKWKYHLTKQLQSFFPDPDAKADAVSDTLLEQCFLPRVLLSMPDAEYTFKFIKALHDWNAPTFRLHSLYSRLFCANRIRNLIFTSSTREAEYLGRFLRLVLDDLARWHKNRPDKDSKSSLGAYDKEGRGSSDQPRLGFSLTVDDNGKPLTCIEHDQFRDLLFTWHKNLNIALKACLNGTEWMHIRNAITVLKAVLQVFPAVDFMGNQFLSQLQKITQQEAASKTATESEEAHRVDLSVAAQGAMSELQKRKKDWVIVQAFRPNAVGGPQADGDKTSPSNLRPMAPDFKSQRAQDGKHNSREHEDGEVQDSQGNRQTPATTNGAGQNQKPTSTDNALPVKPLSAREPPKKDTDSPSGPSRSSTPRAPAVHYARNEARPNSLPNRPPHNLPTRPDVPIPGHFQHGRGNERQDVSRESHDPRSRDPRDPRDSRSFETDRPDRSRGRVSESPRELPARPGQHEPARTPRDDSKSRRTDAPSSSTQQNAPPEVQEPAMNPARAALFAQDVDDRQTKGPDPDRQQGRRPAPDTSLESVNPERAALLAARDENTPSRPPRDAGREWGSQRPSSPRRTGRHGPDAGPMQPTFDDRPGRGFPLPDPRPPSPGPYRADRSLENDPQPRERGGFPRAQPLQRPQEFDHRPPPYQDQNYGRLNPVAAGPEIPSGPRGRGRNATRGGSNASMHPSPRGDGRLPPPDSPQPQTTEVQPPTGPSGRNRPRYDTLSNPATPSTTPGSRDQGIRARKSGPGLDIPSPAPSNTTPATGVHPDRLARLSGPQTQPSSSLPPAGHDHGRSTGPPPNTPDGPASTTRQPSNHSAAPSPVDANAPMGPSGRDPTRAGGGRRQLAGINSTLQQSQAGKPDLSRSTSSTGSSRRNQVPRQMLPNSDIQVLTGGSPTTPSQERPDPTRGEDASGRSEHDRSRRDRDKEPRSSRSSRRSSRDRARERSPGRERDNKEHRDHRERDRDRDRERRASGTGEESNGTSGAREDKGSHRSEREPMGPPTGAREPRNRGEGNAPRTMEDWAATGRIAPPRGAPRDSGPRVPSDDRRDERGSRKRRSEEGMGALNPEREKRPRRG